MGLSRLDSFLQRQGRIAIDSRIFIYELEANSTYSLFSNRVFDWLERPGSSAITSTITMVELLVQPYRDGDRGRVDDCFGILARFPNLRWVAPDLDVADLAARMRARYRLKTPDAVQAATAIHESVSGFLTNDPGFRRVAEMDVFLLDDVL